MNDTQPAASAESAAAAESAPLLEARALGKQFRTGEGEVQVLRELNLTVKRGECVAILGESGAGKSTLLHLLGALDAPSSGGVYFEGRNLAEKDADELAQFRNQSLGFVFQFHHLLPEFSALENVMMPGLLRGKTRAHMHSPASEILEEVGLAKRAAHPVGKLSGGERQRVAVARALVLGPALLLADEPTGNLDPETGARVGQLLLALNRARGAALVIATHNHKLAARMQRALVLEGGALSAATL